MKIAFHFNANHPRFKGSYNLQIQEKCFRILLSGDTEQLHLKVFSGDRLFYSFIRNEERKPKMLSALLNPPYPVWQDLHPSFLDLIQNYDIYVLLFEGISKKTRDFLNSKLKDDDAYFGALQINEANPVHWALYNQKLGLRYRIFGKELRLFYHAWDEDNKENGLADYWRDVFSTVIFEDLGVRQTFFDRYDSYEHARRIADVSEMLGNHLAALVDELIMRLEDLDPNLHDMIYSAFKSLDQIETPEDLAQVSVTCRRILQFFADAVYPPKDEIIDGHRLGKDEYRNRLWAYVNKHVSGKEKDLLILDLNDIGKRMENLDELANKGIHDHVNTRELQRLVLGEMIMLYDLITLTSPPKESSVLPDMDVIKELVEPNPDDKSGNI